MNRDRQAESEKSTETNTMGNRQSEKGGGRGRETEKE